MDPKYDKVIDFLFGPLLRVIRFFYRSYSANRARLARLKAREGIARLMQFLAVAVFVAWIAIWLFASEEDRTRLTEEVRQTLGNYNFGSGSAGEEPEE